MAQKLSKKRNQIQKVVKKVRPSSGVSSTAKSSAGAGVQFSIPNTKYVEGIGRRKVATARVRVYDQPGDFVVNDTLVSQYFATVPLSHSVYNQPFETLGLKGKHAVTVVVSGSGPRSQLGAVVHGLTRALIKMNPDYKPLLKELGLTTRDPRMKETRKIGMGGKARRQRQSPKR